MLVEARAHWLPKEGNSDEEYEDAFYPAAAHSERSVFRCAVADGATETSFSGLWARLLVNGYGRGRLGMRRWDEALASLRCAWQTRVGQDPLPWYAEEKLRQGAFAAFVGLTLSQRPDGSMRWSAVAVGDSCLVQVAEDRPVAYFPITSAAAFNNRPYLIGSLRTHGHVAPMRHRGTAVPGDRFLLMSDAIACWFMSAAEAGARPWKELAEAGGDFEGWMASLRTRRLIRNDDVTLVTVSVLPA